MDFCPKCGKLLKVVTKSAPVLQCPKCTYKEQFKPETVLDYKTKIIKDNQREIAVIDEKVSGLRTFPTVRVICSECGKARSETWVVTVGSEGSKSSFTFFKCTSCGYTRRETE